MCSNKLKSFLEIADVPLLRKDISKLENVKWLKYNLWIRNSNLPGFAEANAEVIELFNNLFKDLKEKNV